MRIYKPTYLNRKTRETRTTAKFYIEVRDPNRRILRLPAFTDKRASETLARNVQQLMDCKASSQHLPVELTRWIENLPPHILTVLTRWGLLEAYTLAASKSLDEHITDWHAVLLARGNTKKHADLSANRVKSLTEACGFKFYGDISAAKVQQELANRRQDKLDDAGHLVRGLSIQSANFYLSCLKSFCRWMLFDGRATMNPVAYLGGQNAEMDRRHTRRMLNSSDFVKLLIAAESGPNRYGMSGHERALIYELAVTTGLRVSELASLTAGAFSLGDLPSVTVSAKSAKNRKSATLPLRVDMAMKLATYLATKLPTARVFARLNKFNAARIIRLDLKAAGIPYMDVNGNVFDFHALRHQFISSLAAAGVHPRTAQELARHSDIKLTMNRYTHVFRGELNKAVALLPNYTAEQAWQTTSTVKNGTDNLTPIESETAHNVIHKSESCWAREGAETRSCTESDGVMVQQGQGEANPLNTRESRDNQGDLLQADGGTRTCNLRFTKPLLCH